MKWIEQIIVRWFLQIAALLSLLFIVVVSIALGRKAITLDALSKATDSLLKAIAIIVGALWSLNRYYTTRTDYPQLRVDLTHDLVPSASLGDEAVFGLLSYRLDIVNTGKTLLPVTGFRVELSNVLIHNKRVAYELLHRWPDAGFHPGSPIEPGSWGAISDAVPCPQDVRAIKVFLDIELDKRGSWTWHRIISVTDIAPAAQPAHVVTAPGQLK